jgi:hypothetical protein
MRLALSSKRSTFSRSPRVSDSGHERLSRAVRRFVRSQTADLAMSAHVVWLKGIDELVANGSVGRSGLEQSRHSRRALI